MASSSLGVIDFSQKRYSGQTLLDRDRRARRELRRRYARSVSREREALQDRTEIMINMRSPLNGKSARAR